MRAEAAFAQESEKLFPVRLDDTPLPLRFIHVHTLNLSGWDGSAGHQALQALENRAAAVELTGVSEFRRA